MLAVLLTIHIIACIALVVAVMLQRSEGGALGMGGGGTGGFISGRGATSLLVKTTMGLAALFFATSIIMTRLNNDANSAPGAIERTIEQQAPVDPFDPLGPAPATTGPGAATPSTSTPGSATPGSATPGSATPGTVTPGAATPGPATAAPASPAPGAAAAPATIPAVDPLAPRTTPAPAAPTLPAPATTTPTTPAPAPQSGGSNN